MHTKWYNCFLILRKSDEKMLKIKINLLPFDKSYWRFFSTQALIVITYYGNIVEQQGIYILQKKQFFFKM